MLCRGNAEEAVNQLKLFFVRTDSAELARDKKIFRGAEEQVLIFRDLHREHCLLLVQTSVFDDDLLHGTRFVGRHFQVRARHTAEDIGESRKVAGAVCVELIEGVDDAPYGFGLCRRPVRSGRFQEVEESQRGSLIPSWYT
jgi:hypothetical protein